MSSGLKTHAPHVSHRAHEISHDSGDVQPEKRPIPTEYRLMSRPFQLTSCFTLGRGHHTVRHKGSPVESKATGSVGQFSHFMPQRQGRCRIIWFTACRLYQTVSIGYI